MRIRLAVLALYLAITPVMVSPVIDLAHPGRATFGGDPLWAAWTLAWNNHVLLDGGHSYFDANIFHPAPGTLALNEHMFAPALFTLPTFALTRDALLAYDLVWLASFPLCALAAWLLAGLVTRDAPSRVLAGLVYAFAFWRYEHALHIQYLWTFGFPLSLWLLHRWRGAQRGWLLVAWVAVMWMQTLTSWYLAVMCMLCNGLWMVWLLAWPQTVEAEGADPPTLRWTRVLPSLSVAWLAIAIVVAWFARPYLGMAPGRPAEVLANTAGWQAYLAPPRSTLLGQWLLWRHQVRLPLWNFETNHFLGFVPLALSILAIVRLRESTDRACRSVVLFFLVVALAALAFSLGPSPAALRTGSFDWTPFGLLAQLPGVQAFRAPARFALLIVLALAMLTAAGAAIVARWPYGRVLQVLAALLILVETRPIAYDIGQPHPITIPRVYQRLRDLPPGAVLSLPAFVVPPEEWFEADYMLFSTVHWRPIMNGYSRTQPPGHAARMAIVAAFPAPHALAELRALGVRYVVTHAERYGVNLRPAVEAARHSSEVELVATEGSDFLWRVK